VADSVPFDFEADRINAEMHGYEAAGSSLPMLLRCGAHQNGDTPNHWELHEVLSKESSPMPSRETFPVEESGARSDARPLTDDGAIWGG